MRRFFSEVKIALALNYHLIRIQRNIFAFQPFLAALELLNSFT
jgi:hypothetical protein